MGWIELGRLVVVGDGIVDFVGLGIDLRKIVVIRGQGRVVVGLFLLALGLLAGFYFSQSISTLGGFQASSFPAHPQIASSSRHTHQSSGPARTANASG